MPAQCAIFSSRVSLMIENTALATKADFFIIEECHVSDVAGLLFIERGPSPKMGRFLPSDGPKYLQMGCR